ncbi:MAG: DNA helicase, partial [Gammaproteobacteria bacterium]|nr:DNA helicase [Gammaproteobacteria bacterium]
VRDSLAQKGASTWAQVLAELSARYAAATPKPFSHVVVDEAQDLGVAELRFLAAVAPEGANNLFFAGDLGQRIFQQPFSWKGLGVDVRGRARTLKVNYRTSHQIRAKADKLLEAEMADADGIEEARGYTVSVFNGAPPVVQTFSEEGDEIKALRQWVVGRIQEGVVPHEIGLFVRSEAQMARAKAAIEAAGIAYKVLDQRVEGTSGFASVGLMHLAKGLEFRAVAVMACDDEVLPLQSRIEEVGEDSDLKEVYDTERQLLYVACTRARDFLMVTGVVPESEFLDDLRGGLGANSLSI